MPKQDKGNTLLHKGMRRLQKPADIARHQQIAAYVTRELYDQIVTVSRATGIPYSEKIRRAMKEWVEDVKARIAKGEKL